MTLPQPLVPCGVNRIGMEGFTLLIRLLFWHLDIRVTAEQLPGFRRCRFQFGKNQAALILLKAYSSGIGEFGQIVEINTSVML